MNNAKPPLCASSSHKLYTIPPFSSSFNRLLPIGLFWYTPLRMIETLAYREIPVPTVRLEPLTYSDETLDLCVKWMNDPDIRQYMYRSLTSNKDRIKEWLELASISESRHYFTIHVDNLPAQAGKNIGFISVRQDKNPKDTAEIGIIIGEKEYQGKGVGKKHYPKC